MGLLSWLFRRKPAAQTPPEQQVTKNQGLAVPVPPDTRTAKPAASRSARPETTNRTTTSQAVWVPPGQSVVLCGYPIPGGMIYTGTKLGGARYRSEPSLIDPALPIGSSRSGVPADLPYWPSYQAISPEQRTRYLVWLATGRRDRTTPIGNVFLFMYGLERRVLLDIAADPGLDDELTAIREEMSALVERYGSTNHSFYGYSTQFIDLIDVIRARDLAHPFPPVTFSPDRFAVPNALRIELGSRATQGAAIPAHIAQAWAWYSPECSPRTPATRCAEEFARLFAIRFAEQFPTGFVVKPNKTPVRVIYRPASAGLEQKIITLPEIPDVFQLKRPGRQLVELFDQVTGELDAYSRWLARNPDRRNTLAAAAVLPTDLIADSFEPLKRLRDQVEQALGQHAFVTIPASDLIAQWNANNAGERFTRADAVALAQTLGRFDFGIEPDVRFGGRLVAPADSVVLFRALAGANQSPGASYGIATAFAGLLVSVARADGSVSGAEVEQLGRHLEETLQLDAGEQRRLQAHYRWLMTEEVKLAGLKTRIGRMTLPQRQQVGEMLIATATMDGVITPGEVTVLTRVFRLLGLDPDTVSSRLHESLTSGRGGAASEPVVVRPGESPETGYLVPPPARQPPENTPPKSTLKLDARVISGKAAETAAISELLGAIFADEPEETPAILKADQPAEVSGPVIAGLDPVHTQLLSRLAQKPEWTRADFECLAADLQLMPDGAIDQINEAAYDRVGDPVLDGDDPVTVDQAVFKEMQS